MGCKAWITVPHTSISVALLKAVPWQRQAQTGVSENEVSRKGSSPSNR